MSFTSQNYGAGKTKRMDRVLIDCLILSCAFSLTMGCCAWFFGPQLLQIYTESSAVISCGVEILSFTTVTYFLCGIMDLIPGALRGMGRSAVPMILSIIGTVGTRIVWIFWIFPYHRSLDILFLSYPVSWILTAWFSSVTILMFGERVSACGGSWKEWPVFGRVLVPFFTYYGTHSLTVMCTHLVPVIAFFKVAAGRMMYPGVLGSTPWDILLLALVLAVEPGVVRLIETRLPWMNGRKKRSK